MKLSANQRRISVQLRRDLVAEVKSRLEPGMDFNTVYGQLLFRLERLEQPSMEQARLLLQNPTALLADHAERKAASHEAQERLKTQVVNANIPKKESDRDQLVADTLAFVARFPMLTVMEVKAVTLLRQENGNRDPQVVHAHQIATPDELADSLAGCQLLEASVGKPGARFSASCQIFVLKDGETLKHDPQAVGRGLAAMDV